MWIFREHHIPSRCSRHVKRRIRKRYRETIRSGRFVTKNCMDRWIHRTFNHLPFTHTTRFSVYLPHNMAFLPSSAEWISVKGTPTVRDEICTICQHKGPGRISIAPCCHVFHQACINEWALVKTTCPNCTLSFQIR